MMMLRTKGQTPEYCRIYCFALSIVCRALCSNIYTHTHIHNDIRTNRRQLTNGHPVERFRLSDCTLAVHYERTLAKIAIDNNI